MEYIGIRARLEGSGLRETQRVQAPMGFGAWQLWHGSWVNM